LRAGAPVNDMMGGLFGALAILAALRARDTTGVGQHVHSGLFENSAWLMSTHMMQYAVSGKVPEPMSAGKRAWGVYDVFTCADGEQLFIGVVTERQWALFTERLGDAALADPAYASNTLRANARATLIPLVAQLLLKQSSQALEALCAQAGLPYARIVNPVALFDDVHLQAGGLVPVTLPNGVATHVPGLPIQFGASRLGTRLDLPKPGEHNAEILDPLR
jgi:crotonobetainyl-CoA:carnitine CoA-transferase CaiB-like acyl-CoA transferase